MTSFYTKEELKKIGFNYLGTNVLISKKTSIYGAERISIGNNVRIDDFCILSTGKGGIEIGNYVHIAAYSSLIGESKITIKDYSSLNRTIKVNLIQININIIRKKKYRNDKNKNVK
jgi:galactoside O-acetyltransferase